MTALAALVEVARDAAREPDVDALRTRVLHNCAAAAGEQTETEPIERALAGDSGPGSEAFRLAAMMHARTQDDFHPAGRVHVGTVVIPAVLTLGAARPLSALAAGYEVLTAVASAYSETAQRRGYRPTGMFGPIGAAATAAIALDVGDVELAAAMALASTMSAGTNQAWVDGSDEWLIEVASASRAGVDAARLAAAGVRGAQNAFEGRAGWSGAFFGDVGANRLGEVLRDRTRRTAHVAIKWYPVSGIAQVPAHLAVQLGVDYGHAEPDRIEVRMTPDELAYPGSRNRGPFHSRSDSLMSISRCVALGYLYRAIPHKRLLDQPGERESKVLKKIVLVADEELVETEAIVTVTVDGHERTQHGRGDDLLYPDWDATGRDLHEIARRSETPAAAIGQLHEAVDQDLDVEAIYRLLGVRT